MNEGRNRRNPKDKTPRRASKDIQALTTARGRGLTKGGRARLASACLEVSPAFREDPPSGISTFDWPVRQSLHLVAWPPVFQVNPAQPQSAQHCLGNVWWAWHPPGGLPATYVGLPRDAPLPTGGWLRMQREYHLTPIRHNFGIQSPQGKQNFPNCVCDSRQVGGQLSPIM